MYMLNIQKCMFVLQLRCTLHSAAWESTVSGASSHTGTQLSSPQRPHNPQAQHPVIPTHQMLCSDCQCWKTRGTSLSRLTLRHALGVCPRPRASSPSPGRGCAGPGVCPGTGAGLELSSWGRREGEALSPGTSQRSWLGTLSSTHVPSQLPEH